MPYGEKNLEIGGGGSQIFGNNNGVIQELWLKSLGASDQVEVLFLLFFFMLIKGEEVEDFIGYKLKLEIHCKRFSFRRIEKRKKI